MGGTDEQKISSECKSSRDVCVAVLGGVGVGKSNVVLRCLCRQFREKHIETVEDTYHITQRPSSGNPGWSINISDCSGCNGGMNFPAMRKIHIQKASAFMLVYSVDDNGSWEAIRDLMKEINDQRTDSPPVLIVGNKSDLKDRFMSEKEARILSQMNFSADYQEVSARDSDDLSGLVRHLANAAGLGVTPEQMKKSLLDDKRRHSEPVVRSGKRPSIGLLGQLKGVTILRDRSASLL